jgi:hypothetical protein
MCVPQRRINIDLIVRQVIPLHPYFYCGTAALQEREKVCERTTAAARSILASGSATEFHWHDAINALGCNRASMPCS